jgi:23S rRNA pseudouridine955/2504/2580 synthase
MPELRTIDPDDDGIRIDRWFKRHCPQVTHVLLQKLLRKGEVRLDGKRADAGTRVAAGQSMRLPPQVIHAKDERPQKPAAEAKHPLATKDMGSLADRILYMDKQVIVLDKPAGLATQGGSGLTKHVDGMLDSLQYEKPTRPKLVHRLDRDTSGVLLIARTALAASGLSASLALRDTSKVYWALTRGVPKQKNGVVKGALAKEGTRGKDERMTLSDDDDAKFALTEYAVMGTAGTEFAWVAARPITGRTHQIRVHLASIGHPLLGDEVYGTGFRTKSVLLPQQAQDALKALGRQALHAHILSVKHPKSAEILRFRSELPPDLARLRRELAAMQADSSEK